MGWQWRHSVWINCRRHVGGIRCCYTVMT